MQTFSWSTSRRRLRSQDEARRPAARRGFILLWMTFWCVLSFVVPSRYLYSSIRVVGHSMAPTLADGDWRLVNRWRLFLAGATHADMVVLTEPYSRTKVVKRIIGVPGDTVQIRPDGVYVNYRRSQEIYLPHGVQTWSRRMGEQPLHLQKGQYFVMGDNRLFSLDSRWYGPVRESDLQGIVTY